MCAYSFSPNIELDDVLLDLDQQSGIYESVLDQLDRTSVNTSQLTISPDEPLDPQQFEYMFTIRLQSRGKTRFEYEGLRQRLECILDAHTYDWHISLINDDDPYMLHVPCAPNLMMADSSKTTLCVQIDMNGRPLKLETLVLIFNVFWRLRASTLAWLRFWISSYNDCLNMKQPVNLFMLFHPSNENSFRMCVLKYVSELMTGKLEPGHLDILSGYLLEMIAWTDPNASQDDIKRRLQKIQQRVAHQQS